MRIILNLFVTILLLHSCKNSNKTDSKNDTKKAEDTIYVFYNNSNKGNLKQRIIKVNDSIDKVEYFFRNGLIDKEGEILYDKYKYGKWVYYAYENENYDKQIIEYKFIDSIEYLNQIWYVDSFNDTIGGNYLKHTKINNNYMLGDTLNIQFYMHTPLVNNDAKLNLIYATNEKFNLFFSNQNEIEKDTVMSIYEINNLKGNELEKYKRWVDMNYILTKKGKHWIRNILVEKFDSIYGDTLSSQIRKVYFEKKIHVIDTIN